MPSFSGGSQRHLNTARPELRILFEKVISVVPPRLDFGIICGHRSVEIQQDLFAKGLTQLDGINEPSKHNYEPSDAVDWVPYDQQFGYLHGNETNLNQMSEVLGITKAQALEEIRYRYHQIHGVISSKAYTLGYKIRWGGDWDGDGYTQDSGFIDLPHTEWAGSYD